MKIAIVTGSSSGIGRAVARRLARQQFGVIVTYHRQSAGAEQVVTEITRAHGRAVALKLDLSDTAGLGAFVDQVRTTLRSTFERADFDCLVNNAGMGGGTPFAEVTESHFDTMFGTNFKGPYFLTQKLVPLLVEGGQIINVSSGSSHLVSVGYSAYGPAKAALTALTRYWAKELAPRKIRVNSVSPGPVLTNIADGAFAKNPEYIAPLAAQTLVGRIAQPEDVADAIAGLLSDDFRYVTAADLDVSGGFLI